MADDRYALGALEDPPDERDYQLAMLAAPPAIVPAALSWRSAMPGVRNQGQLGSCVAFAALGVKEYQDGENLSEQWLYGACKAVDGYAGEGTYPRTACDRLVKLGAPEERFQPYEGRYPPARPPLDGANDNATLYRAKAYARVGTDPESMKAAIQQQGPLLVGVRWFANWYNVGTRLPEPIGSAVGGHAICAVGYTPEGLEFRNSWGTGWGDGGYALMPWSVWESVNQGAWAIVDLPEAPRHWPDWPEGWLAEQDKLYQRGVMLGYQDGTFRPWEPVLRRHVALILGRLGMSYDGKFLQDYDTATRGWTRDHFSGLEWLEARWDESLSRFALALLVARAI